MMRQRTAVPSDQHDPAAFRGLPAAPDLAAVEHEVLVRWEAGTVFARSMSQTAGGQRWVCLDAPMAASGMPGIHVVPGLVITDLFRRFRTMQGFSVPRRAGWDCHGLRVEVAVERELGLSGPADIEAYGVTRFTARCRESALRHARAHADLSERIGSWAGLADAYRTMDPGYIEAVWSSLRRLFDAGLLIRDYRVTPYCPRCQTPLGEYELAQPGAYRKVTDSAVTVRFPVTSLPDGLSPWLRGADLLSCTTAPWTLVSNAAVAVHPDRSYVVARRAGHDDRVIVSEAAFVRTLGEGWHIATRFSGAELAGATYAPTFGLAGSAASRVIMGRFVAAESGTGLMHLAPAFGDDAMVTGQQHGLPVLRPIGPDGRFDRRVPLVGGVFFKEADPILIQSLADRGLLFAQERQDRHCPHCWRCGTPLLWYALSAWYIRNSAAGGGPIEGHDQVRWVPATAASGHGLRQLAETDWALSRTRYWGTPMPLWECPEGHVTCVGSLAQLSELAGRDLSGLDPHRPAIDAVTIACPDCGGTASRVPEVVDAGYDVGVMPLTATGSPGGDQATGPADLVADSADQGAGWLHALVTVSSLVAGQPAVSNALSLGPVLDESGRPMGSGAGNVAEPDPVIERYGADALRWYLAAAAPPSASRKMSAEVLDEVVRKIVLTYWNTTAFFVLYANAAAERLPSWRPGSPDAPPPAARPALDRWILSELQVLIGEVTVALEAYQPAVAGRRIAIFIDNLSNWYLRRSRRRFRPDAVTDAVAGDRGAAFATLGQCLHVLTRLMAPVMPFVTDYVWDVIRAEDDPDSVHLAPWPEPVSMLVDDGIAAQMALARRLAELGRSARAASMIRIRQPLAAAMISSAAYAELGPQLRDLVADELNVRALAEMDFAAELPDELTVRPNFRALGRRFGKDTAAIAAAIGTADPAAAAASLRATGSFAVPLDGGRVLLTSDEILAANSPLPGWTLATEGSDAVAVNTVVTPGLHREGLAREIIRAVQNARKADRLDVGQPIALRWTALTGDVALALTEHAELIGREVLAADYGPADYCPADYCPADSGLIGSGPAAAGGTGQHVCPELSLTFWITPAGP
jgi:isoleucyl-tRNA synthetase